MRDVTDNICQHVTSDRQLSRQAQADFAAGKRVKALSSIERPVRLKLDRIEAAETLKDLAALPGNRFESLKGDRKGQVQHPHQRPMADLLRVAKQISGTDERGDRGLPLGRTPCHALQFTQGSTWPKNLTP